MNYLTIPFLAALYLMRKQNLLFILKSFAAKVIFPSTR